MKADQLIPGNWYYHNDVLVNFIFNVTTDARGYRFERAIRRSYSAFSLNKEEIEKDITHKLEYIEEADYKICCNKKCILYFNQFECDAIPCRKFDGEGESQGYYIKSELQ